MTQEIASHVIDLLPAFVLDALTDDEMSQVSEHLAGCPSCQNEFAQLQQVVDELSLAAVQSRPAPELKQKLMASIHSRRIKTVSNTRPAPNVQSLLVFLRGHLAALGVALILLLLVGNLFLWRQLNLTLQQTSTPMRVITLNGSQFSPQAIGTLVINPNDQYFTLVVDRLSSLEADKQYQVWLIKGTEHTSAGVFSVDQNGYALLQIQAPMSLSQYDAIGISIEPWGGSPKPTGPNVLHGYLAR